MLIGINQSFIKIYVLTTVKLLYYQNINRPPSHLNVPIDISGQVQKLRMISLYQMFRLIFGLVISGFILIIIIHFIGVYTDLQEDSQRAQIMKSFLKTAGDVYLTGNPVDFTSFSMQEFKITFDSTEPEGIVSNTGKTPVYFPLFFSFGKKVFIWKGELDMGWWKFRFVEAMPRTRIIFNPLSPDWDLIKEIVYLLPDSEFFEPKITFGFCDSSLLQEKLCGGEFCEKQEFLFQLLSPPQSFSKCSTQMPDGAVLITISQSCSSTFSQGFCLTPPNSDGIGNLYFKSVQDPLLYKDPLDIVSALIGGEEKDIYGNSGETLFEYKNNAFREELVLAAKMMSNRALLVGSKHPPGSECNLAFSSFLNKINSLHSMLSDKDYYKNFGKTTILVNQLKSAKSDYQELVNRGCDYP